jgi:hypothetical protein
MDGYAAEVEQKMPRFFGWLSEKDRRRYAAVEAAKLGHGGVEYIARVLACDPKTMRQGLRELEEAEDAAVGRLRTKGAAACPVPWPSRPERRTSAPCCRSAPRAIRCAQGYCGRTCHGASYRDAWERWAPRQVVAPSDGCCGSCIEIAARRGRKRPWATIPTATRHLSTLRGGGASTRRLVMR